MKQIIKQGATSKKLVVFVQDASKTTGVGLTGLTNASSGLIWYYYREDSTTATSVSVVGETLGTWTSGGFKEISSTNMPGFYEIGVPNAVLAATNAPTWAVMQLSGVTNMVPVNVEVELSAFDLTVATQPVNVTTFGGTAGTFVAGLPNVNVVDFGGTAGTFTSGIPNVAATLIGTPAVNVTQFGGTNGTFTSGVPNANAAGVTGTVTANVVAWNGAAVGVPANPGYPDVNVKYFVGVPASVDANQLPRVDVVDWGDSPVANVNIAGVPIVDLGAAGGNGLTFSGGFLETAIATNLDKTGYSLVASQITVKKDVALNGFTFPMFSSTPPSSLATGLSVTTTRSIDGGSVAGTTNSVTEVGSGIYKINLSAADLNGNSITFLFTATGALDAAITIVTQP